ncbi:hypothetical protein DM02DRAFT_674005 [Periconia macrospinosa]|uniref:Zn(2)-C6 fungal-type domain-containing protein n=1 Tax=Periconia macrospinosa TaxID=97972 RepID=A0A2V1DHM2_9PLEO|nr:hypothetical protein DM02DRAFT_674005 [Periconia macrospinosa]
MPKQRQTCTRCSQRRQKCDRKSPCTRCVQNKEAHLCTMEWSAGYNPAVHRKYPRKVSSSRTRASSGEETSSSVIPSPNDAQPQRSMPFRVALPETQTDGLFHSRELSYPSAPSSTAGTESTPGLPTTSSTNVNFITYGRSDFADIRISSLLQAKEEYQSQQALAEQRFNPEGADKNSDTNGANGFSPAAQSVEVHHLQSLLPCKEQLLKMVDYHHQCMSYWVGGVYDGPSFRKSVLEAYDDDSVINLRKNGWLWSALLFSVLSASMIGSCETVSASWGFSDSEKLRLSRTWGSALISCLHLGDYATAYHVYSVQAIFNMHTSEHLVGSTKEWAVYQSAAIVIARGLGFHKLGPHPEDDIAPRDMTTKQREALMQREIGRRCWIGLSSQDWLCSTSQGMYQIHKRHFTTILPRHFDEYTWERIRDDNVPTHTMMTTFLNEVAYQLSRYLDDMIDAPCLESKYNVVLKYDALIRAINLEKLPRFLRPTTPYNATWPQWTRWARRSYEASSAHKIIMIHQSFLGKSFKDPRYTYSRWACVSSAKIVVELMKTRYPEEPQWWVEHAFVVTAGLVLGLDLFHRGGKGSEAAESKAGVEQAVKILLNWPTSSVAIHGIRLLTSLLEEHTKNTSPQSSSKQHDGQQQQREHNPPSPENMGPLAIAEAARVSASIQPPQQPQQQLEEEQVAQNQDIFVSEPSWMNIDFDIDMMNLDMLVDPGVNSNVFFEGMLGVPGSNDYNPLLFQSL